MDLLPRRLAPALGLALALLAAMLLPSSAAASSRQRTVFDATAYLIGDVTSAQRRNRLDELDRMGVDTLRVLLRWHNLVPSPDQPKPPARFNASDPHDYPRGLWDGIDEMVSGAEARGIRVLLTIGAPVPQWATVSGQSTVKNPLPQEYMQLMTAVGRRYGGSFRPGGSGLGCVLSVCPPVGQPQPPLPKVTSFAVWSEPNQDLFLQPQYRGGRPYAGRLYRRLFLAAQQGLARSGHDKDLLLIGETAPSGGRSSTDPIDFLRGVLCLSPAFRPRGKCARIRADGWAHHPYSPGVAPFETSSNRGLINMATLGRLGAALRKAARAGRTKGRLPIYITEFGVQSVPDHQFGVSLKRQAEYLGISEFMAWRRKDVRSYGQYLMADDPPSFEFSFTTGLKLHSGRKKPAYKAFPLTLAVRRRGHRVLVWGHLRPGNGRRQVEVRVGGRGRDGRLRRLRTNARGYFSFGSAFRAGRRWRAVASTDGRRLKGPWVRAYRLP